MFSSETEQSFVEEWNNTQVSFPDHQCIHHLFEAQVAKTPQSIAVVFGDKQLTYHELNQQANQLAYYLQSLGVGTESLIGICVERSLEMVIGLLGVFKAGGAYLPLDPAYPPDRLAFMMEDAHIAVLLTQSHLQDNLPACQAQIVCLDTIRQLNGQDACPTSEVKPNNLAYVIYTSGSTGKPKGVMLEHRGLYNLVQDQSHRFEVIPASRVLQFVSFSFDVSILEIMMPLCVGARLYLAAKEALLPGQTLIQLLQNNGITHLLIPASVLTLLPLAELPTLRVIVAGGEASAVSLAEAWSKGRRFFNAYGPTETTVCATIKEYFKGDQTLPIGRPIANTEIYILDEHLRHVPIGEQGELCIGGVGLARCYLNRPELTAMKFIAHPFKAEPTARLYKTGDLARFLPDGNIEFLGRIDHQVKVRGFRIELGEIEAVLGQYPKVRHAVVMPYENRPGDKRLVAYVVLYQPQSAESLFSELRNFLQEKLPSHMVPSAFITIEALPLTPNGKIDRYALPAPTAIHFDRTTDFVPPSTPTEQTMTAIWSEVFNAAPLSIEDNFVELGGHSLLAAQIMARVRDRWGVELPIRCFFENQPTIANLAKIIDQKTTESSQLPPPIAPVSRHVPLPVSFAQQQFWLLNEQYKGRPTYNESLTIRLTGQVNITALEQSLNELVKRHEIFRTTISMVNQELRQIIHEPFPFPLKIINLDTFPQDEREAEAHRLATAELQRSFDLTQIPLLRGTLIQLNQADARLFLAIHHFIIDGVSICNILLPELEKLYTAFSQGQPSPLPEITIQYADFAVWQRAWLTEDVLAPSLTYWKKKMAGLSALQLPTDYPMPAEMLFKGFHQPFTLTENLSQQLKTFSREAGVSLFTTLVAATQVLLYRYSGQEDFALGVVVDGHNRPELEPIMGNFLNTLPLRADLSGAPTFRELLKRVQQATLEAYEFQNVPFEILVKELQPGQRNQPLFNVAFTLEPPLTKSQLGWDMNQQDIHSGSAKVSLYFEFEDRPEAIIGRVEYQIDLFADDTIRRMIECYQTLLAGIVAQPDQKIFALPLLPEAQSQQLLTEWNKVETSEVLETSEVRYIHELFEAQARQTPQAIAVVCGDKQLTYQELNDHANQLAHYLQTLGVQAEERVGICVERSPDLIISLLAVLKAGGAFVTLDHVHPPERLNFILNDGEIGILLTQFHLLDRFANYRGQIIDCERGPHRFLKPVRSAANLNYKIELNNLAYIIYTSGTTGLPKGVAVEYHGLLNLVDQYHQIFQISPTDHSTQIVSSGFDVVVSEIFPFLTAGATIHIIDDHTRLDPKQLQKYLTEKNITIVTLPVSIAEQLLRFKWPVNSSLKTMIIGGDRLHFYPLSPLPFQVFNCYGPTEDTVWTTYYLFSKEHAYHTVSLIGKPIANHQVYILDKHQNPVPIGVAGELCIGGIGVARGYINRPELTAQSFISNPYPLSQGGYERLYRTGDLARYLPDGNIEFLGRIDHQVKIRGVRIELGEIELVLMQHPAVFQNVVIVREDRPGDKRLAAYVVFHQGQSTTPSQLRSYLKEKLPDYMVPSTFVIMDALPLNPNGKIDRRALPVPELNVTEDFVPPRTSTEKTLAMIWAEVLGREKVGIYDNFFELGGHSLLISQIISRIQDSFSVELSLHTLAEKPTVAQIAQIIDILSTGDMAVIGKRASIDFEAEVMLDCQIYPENKLPSLSYPIKPKAIFLTGGTGFLGAYLLHDLLQQTSANIYCLVRSPNIWEGKQRIKKNLESYGLWNGLYASRIIPVIGDLAKPFLGLSPTEFDHLAHQIDLIYHNGAWVNFIYPYSVLKPANVLGTQEVLRLASQAKVKPMHYISTCDIFSTLGCSNRREIIYEEDDIKESEPYLQTDIGYIQSKWVAERLVWVAKERGIPVTIYRLGFTLGHHQTGHTYTSHYIYRLIKGCIQLGSFPDMVNQRWGFTPIDFTSRAVVYLAMNSKLSETVFHVIPQPAQFITFVELFEMIRLYGYPLKKLSPKQWQNELRQYVKKDDPLFPFVSLLTQPVTIVNQEPITAMELYQNTPLADCKNMMAVLAGTDIICPSLDEKLLDIYFSYLIKSGFLEPPPSKK